MNKKTRYIILFGFLSTLLVLGVSYVFGAPTFTIHRSLISETDNTYYLGTTSPSNVRWRALFLGTGTSTGAGGFDISGGCFAIGGVCLPSTGVSGTGVANRIAYFSGASALTSDADFVVDGDLGRLTATYASSTFITTTYASTTAVTIADEFWITPLTSALLQTDSTGLLAEYAGTSCTNQFPRSLSALGVATCATIVAGDVDLADLTATDGTLTFSGTYDGQTARTIGIALGNSNSWTASTTISAMLNVEALSLTASGTIDTLNTNTARIGTSTTQTANINTALIGTTTIQRANINACGGNGCSDLYGFLIATSSSLFGTRVDFPTKPYAYTVTRITCIVVGGTSKVITMTDGTNAMDSITCLTTETLDDGSIANNTVTAGEAMRVNMGVTSGNVDSVSIGIYGIKGQ